MLTRQPNNHHYGSIVLMLMQDRCCWCKYPTHVTCRFEQLALGYDEDDIGSLADDDPDVAGDTAVDDFSDALVNPYAPGWQNPHTRHPGGSTCPDLGLINGSPVSLSQSQLMPALSSPRTVSLPARQRRRTTSGVGRGWRVCRTGRLPRMRGLRTRRPAQPPLPRWQR